MDPSSQRFRRKGCDRKRNVRAHEPSKAEMNARVPGGIRELQRDRAAVWFNCDLELQEAAALALGLNCAGDEHQHIFAGSKAQTITFGQLVAFVGTPQKL
jgi:hypothetical protein